MGIFVYTYTFQNKRTHIYLYTYTVMSILSLFGECLNLNLFKCTLCYTGFKSKKSLKKHIKKFHEVGSKFYVNMKKIGSGNFGEIRIGKNLNNNEKVAVKLEPIEDPMKPKLYLEYEFYKMLGNHEGIPETYIFDSFNDNKYNALVMELLGPSLEDLKNSHNGTFSLKTIILIAVQVIHILEYIHSKNLIHRDIKPENFLLGQTSTKKENVIHVVDFGLSKEFVDKENGKHIPYKEYKGMIGPGTPSFMSINAHLGKEQSRRDDLESLGYMLLYFLRGDLPWQWHKKEETIKDKLNKILDLKMTMSITKLCKNCTTVEVEETMVAYFQLVRNLDFDEAPNYDDLRMLFSQLMKNGGYDNNETFDWIT